ncbi:hypothetical protein ABZZ47_02970 [Streptomyces sp. NPDC006465]|uniref:dTMP kinase n=1 Tax=Streptomyces sp. NPDC006465 TaxID=3157174 RepID=UPI0033A8A7FC
MFLVMEGIDGSGKSTVARLVERELNSPGSVGTAGSGGKKALGPLGAEAAARADRLRRLIWASPEADGDTFGATHWILLIASWYAGLARLRADLTDPDRIAVMDGWYYRNIAKTLVREPLDAQWVESLFAPVPEPELTVLLDVAPETAWARRDSFKDTETGRWDGFTGPPRDAFHAYQSVVRGELLRMAGERGWLVLAPDPDEPPERIAQAVVDRVRTTRRQP